MSFDEPEPRAEREPTPATPTEAGAGEIVQRTASRLVLLIGLAYLVLAAFASGLAWSTCLGLRASAASRDRVVESEPFPEPQDITPPSLPPRPPAPPVRDPNAPGLHTRPDGSRYLIVPIPQPCRGPRPRASLPVGGAA